MSDRFFLFIKSLVVDWGLKKKKEKKKKVSTGTRTTFDTRI